MDLCLRLRASTGEGDTGGVRMGSNASAASVRTAKQWAGRASALRTGSGGLIDASGSAFRAGK